MNAIHGWNLSSKRDRFFFFFFDFSTRKLPASHPIYTYESERYNAIISYLFRVLLQGHRMRFTRIVVSESFRPNTCDWSEIKAIC